MYGATIQITYLLAGLLKECYSFLTIYVTFLLWPGV